jgi:hypothetical protein
MLTDERLLGIFCNCAEENTGVKEEDKVEKGENCKMKSFVICTSRRALLR